MKMALTPCINSVYKRGAQIMSTRLPRVTKFGMVAHNIFGSPV